MRDERDAQGEKSQAVREPEVHFETQGEKEGQEEGKREGDSDRDAACESIDFFCRALFEIHDREQDRCRNGQGDEEALIGVEGRGKQGGVVGAPLGMW